MTAVREATPLGRPLQPILLCAYEVDAEPIFDSLNQTLCADHDVTDSDLHCPAWRTVMYGGAVPASQALADRLIESGFVGMLVRSFAAGARPEDLNIVFWRWGDRLPSRIVVDMDDVQPRTVHDDVESLKAGAAWSSTCSISEGIPGS